MVKNCSLLLLKSVTLFYRYTTYNKIVESNSINKIFDVIKVTNVKLSYFDFKIFQDT